MEYLDTALRLIAATLIGGAIGLNRDLHGKPIGVRTLALVALATAMAVAMIVALAGDQSHIDAVSRVIQGVLTGIGFLGAGVIMRDTEGHKVKGLTTAACTWLTACVGMVCGLATWPILIVGVALTFGILLCGGRIEDAVHRRLGGRHNGNGAGDDETG